MENLKAVTFSFDDGIYSDIRLVELFNKYGARCTFNLNSGEMTSARKWTYNNGFEVWRLDAEQAKKLYAGHEVAVHSFSHPHLEQLDEQALRNEIGFDKFILEKLFETSICGMAYPYGTYNEQVISVAKQLGIKYSRTVESTHSFDLPEEPLKFHPTCHFADPEIDKILDSFIELRPTKPQVLSIWGHSYELDGKYGWDVMERILRKICNRKDIFYGTNSETILR